MLNHSYPTGSLAHDRYSDMLVRAERRRTVRLPRGLSTASPRVLAASRRPGAGGTPSSARPGFKVRFPSAVGRVLAAVTGIAAVVCMFGPGASADVNTSSNGYGTTVMSNCTIYVGDQASSSLYAVGDTTVSCGSRHNIWVYTRLYRNGTLVATSANPYSYLAGTTSVHDVPTAAMHCGGRAQWYTTSSMIIDGGAWKTWQGPTENFTPSC